jgi:endonuclease/exonuclease/phosphatase family metal-dependent hydrolase
MRNLSYLPRNAGCAVLFMLSLCFETSAADAPLRIMSANLNGNTQSYQPFALRIFEGLKPDVVAIQEFNYGNNSDTDLRSLIDTAFGTNFSYFRETNGYSIPNGIISRFPIGAAGSWDDPNVPDRGFAWAQILLPGTNPLYVVSVHLNGSAGATVRDTEASNIKSLVQSAFSNAWVIVAGDFNTDSRTEACISTFKTFLSDNPIPTDAESGGDPDTNEPRNKPYDYVLPSFSMTNFLTTAVFPSHSFSNGLVFDSRVYQPLSDVNPVLINDSTNAQHMAVIKDFLISGVSTASNPPVIVTQPQSQGVYTGTDATFRVAVTGTVPFTYEWRFEGATLLGATTSAYTRTNAQPADAGGYSVVITNSFGSVTSLVATLTVSTAPYISAGPQSQSVFEGQDATFSVTATGATPLAYQWRLNGSDISGAIASAYTRANVQDTDAGNYQVVITNSSGSITSSPALLTVLSSGQSSVIAQWNFNNTNVSLTSPPPSTGAGTISLVGGTTASGWVSGTGSADTNASNSAWNTTTYPAQGTGNKSAGAQFKVSTMGWQNIVVRWDARASGTGSKYTRLQYTTNGSTFTDFPTGVSVSGITFESKTNSMTAIPSVNNNSNFAFRIVAEFESTALNDANANYVGAGGTYGPGGTTRFDLVTISGAPIPPPIAAPASLRSAGFTNQQFTFNLSGSLGSNYIIQAASDLTLSNWISLQTNTSPFKFSDSNAISFPARFYRALASP